MNQEIMSFRRDSSELRSILLEGTLLRHGEYLSARPREIVSNSKEAESIVFELIRPEGLFKPSVFQIWFQAVRPETLLMSLTPVLSILLYGTVLKKWGFSWEVGILALLGLIFFQIALNSLNDCEDYLRLVDLPGRLGGSGVIQKGWVSAKQVRRLGYISLIMGIICGLPAVAVSPKILLGIGGVSTLGVLIYSNRPFGIKYRALGDFAVFMLGGPLLAFGFSQAAFQRLELPLFLIGIFFGFMAWGVCHCNHLKDIEVDRSNGISTLASFLGFRGSRHWVAGLYGAAYLCIFLGVIFGILPKSVSIFVTLGLPWVIRLVLRVYKASGPSSALLVSIRYDAVNLHVLLGSLVCLSLGIKLFSPFN